MRRIHHILFLFGTCIVQKKIYVGTNTKTQKAKNIKKHRKVSFCVDVGVNAPNIFGVMGRGTAKLLKEKKTVNRIAKKFFYDILNH